VLTRVDLRGTTTDPRDVLPRAQLDVAAAIEQIRPTVEAVHQHGASAVLAATERFDHVRPRRLRVPAEAIAAAADTLDDAVRAALQTSIDRARAVHADQRRTDVTTQVVPGGTVTERWVPVSRVGLYVPGGLAPLLSSVVMNVVPAQLAGVTSIALASPPQRDTGLPHPGIPRPAPCSASTRCTRWAAPRRSPRSRTACAPRPPPTRTIRVPVRRAAGCWSRSTW
jgi:histidinol dehydrogenase